MYSVVDDNNSNENQPTPQKQGIKEMTMKENAKTERRSAAMRIVYNLTDELGLVSKLRSTADTLENLCNWLKDNQNNGDRYNAVDLIVSIETALSGLKMDVDMSCVLSRKNAAKFEALNDLLED